jgi:hypothetical protein
MSSSDEPTATNILEALIQEPENDEILSQTKHLIRTDAESFNNAANDVAQRNQNSFAKTSVNAPWNLLPNPNHWSNCIGEQSCDPVEKLYPKSLQDLRNAVNLGREKKLNVRAVGSGHSFSNVAPTDGILLDPKGMNRILPVDVASLRDPGLKSNLFSVESGITIKDLNTALDKAGLALINMGAYDGQTLAGAISTGTHGKGLSLGPIASSVRSLTLVSETGKVYQIEPAGGISDPATFGNNHTYIELVQNDDWFNSAVIAMGCLGLIYSYTLAVMPAYYLKEKRSLDTWENVKTQLAMQPNGPFPTVLTSNRHFEIDINPYAVDDVHSCIVQTTNIVAATHASGSRGFANWLAGLLASWPAAENFLVDILNSLPFLSPEIVNSALKSLVDDNYIDKSFIVLSIGAVDNVKALAMELSFPVDEQLVENIDNVLSVFADEAKSRKWYLAGPIALRFVAESQAFLAPMQGRATCMVELDMLVGVTSGKDLLKAVKARMATEYPLLRVHWGLDLDTVDGEEVKRTYEMFPKWLDMYRELNASGMWDGRFTERLGISTRKKND